MGLLTKNKSITVTNRNKTYYSNKGYNIPKLTKNGSCQITVSVEDLNPNSKEQVKVKCDNCNKEYIKRYKDYVASVGHSEGCYCKQCVGLVRRSGTNNPMYKPELTSEYRSHKRMTNEYRNMRLTVLSRDYYTCYCCGIKSDRDLIVHHLNNYKDHKNDRLNIDNCVTLCKGCHLSYHAIYGKSNNTKEQFEEWLGYKLNLNADYKRISTRQIVCLETGIIYNSTYDLSKEINVKTPEIIRHCSMKGTMGKNNQLLYVTQIRGYHYLWMDKYVNMNTDDIADYLIWCFNHYNRIQVKCLNTNKIYKSVSDASRDMNVAVGSIMDYINKKQTYGGIDTNGNKLYWEKYTPNFTLLAEEYYNKRNYLCNSINNNGITASQEVLI